MRAILFFTIAFFTVSSLQAKILTTIPFGNSKIVLTDSAETARILGLSDAYTASFTNFDLQGRLESTGTVTQQDYLALAVKESRTWTVEEQVALRNTFEKIADWCKNNGIVLNLPSTIVIAKTTGKEELGSEGYTRGNTIVLASKPEMHLIAHELFHVFSRYNPEIRDELYRIVHFQKCEPIAYQKAFHNLILTNPDCPVVEHYVVVPFSLFGITGDMVKATLVLYSESNYEGGDVFEKYLKVGLLELTDDKQKLKPATRNGKTSYIELGEENMGKVVEYLGANTGYLLHPEEISAEHFAMMIMEKKVPHQESLTEMMQVLQAKSKK